MKILPILFLIAALPIICFSQSLEGNWKGRLTTSQIGSSFGPSFGANRYQAIDLTVTLNKDSSYTVNSFTKGIDLFGKEITVVCKLTEQHSKDSVYLEEVKAIMPKDFMRLCFKKMFLRIKVRKKLIELNGDWKCAAENSTSSGTIYFWKKNK